MLDLPCSSQRRRPSPGISRAFLAGASVLMLPLLAGCGAGMPPPATAAASAAPAVSVEYVTVRAGRIPASLELPGLVTAVRSATLTAPVAGVIRSLADEGQRVPASAMLALLEAPGLPEQVSAARASMDAAERRRAGAGVAVKEALADTALATGVLEQALRSADAERDRRKAALAEAELQAKTEPARLQAEVQAAEAHTRLTRSGEREQKIKQLEAGLSVARAELGVARSQLKRARMLYGQGYASANDYEVAALNVQRGQANVVQHEQELSLEKAGGHPEAVAEAEKQAEVARQALKAAEGLKEQVEERRAELREAEADVQKATRNLENARKNRLSIAKAREDAAAADAEAERSRMELREASERLRQSVVRAPFAGQVVRRSAHPGETVTLGAPLLELVDPAALQFEAVVSDEQVARLREGTPLRVSVPAAGASLSGRMGEIILAADAMKRSYRVRVALPRSASLRPGMIGTARIALRDGGAAITLPFQALRRHFPAEHRGEVLVLRGGRLEARPVRLAAAGTSSGAGEVRVLAGLSPGDQVVVSDAAAAPVGAVVQAREAARP